MMSTATRMPGCYVEDGIVYPDDDGVEMGDNSAQTDWISFLLVNLTSFYADDPDVAVMANMNWYPVKGKSKICRAPDVMVAFGRSKEYRGSYIQWTEDNIAPQVVFEILSPSNSTSEMAEKLSFYVQYEVEEFYTHDPDTNTLHAWIRKGGQLLNVPTQPTFVSPRMQIRFENTADEGMKVYQPDGTAFLNPADAVRRAATAEWKFEQAVVEIAALRERLRQAGLE